MKIRQQFDLPGALDPFTLLKVSRAFHDIAGGEHLEILYTGEQPPRELFKVLPAAQYEIVEQDQYENPARARIVLRKKNASSSPSREEGRSDNGCACS